MLLASSWRTDVLLMMLVGTEYLFTGTPARHPFVIATRACQVQLLRNIKHENIAVCYGLVLNEKRELFTRWQGGWDVRLTTNHHLAPKLRMCRAMPPLPTCHYVAHRNITFRSCRFVLAQSKRFPKTKEWGTT
jgi:hypothetical protein